MGHLLAAYFKGFGQLSDPRTRAVIFKSIAWTVALFLGLYVSLYVALKATTFIAIGFLEVFFDFIAQFGVMALTWYLFPAVVTAVGSLMLDSVVEAVEKRHYPEKQMVTGLTFRQSVLPTIKLLGVTVGYNLLILPLFLVPPLWPAIPFIFIALNGYLLSREYFELVALRRLSPLEAKSMYNRWKTPLFIGGLGFAFMLSIPLLNLITPVIATAAMVHLFETWCNKDGLQVRSQTSHNNKDQTDMLNSQTGKSALNSDDDAIPLPGPDQK